MTQFFVTKFGAPVWGGSSTSTGHGLFSFVNIDNLEPPKLGVFMNFSWFRAAAHILRVNCAEMASDKPGQPV